MIEILWWNVNRKPNILICNNSPIKSKQYQIIFTSETSIGYNGLPVIPKYTLFADSTVLTRNHGGIATYISDNIASHVFNITYKQSYTAFRLDFCPTYIFIGTYIQPESSNYYTPVMFTDVVNLLMKCKERNLIPILGGDFNSRPGNLSNLNVNMKYAENVDKTSNKHGITHFKDICSVGNVFPINHLSYQRKQFPGAFTYHKADKHSQIDFVLTNNIGIRSVECFSIIDINWHLSDHLPISLSIKTTEAISASSILKRARDPNYEFDPNATIIKRFTKTYNYTVMQDYLIQHQGTIEPEIINHIDNNDIGFAITTLDSYIENAHKVSQIPQAVNITENHNYKQMEKANAAFVKYQNNLHDDSKSENEIENSLEQYKICRKELTHEMFQVETGNWNKLVNNKNSKELWNKIDWNGNTSHTPNKHPMLDDLVNHYEDLYSRDDPTEPQKIANLSSSTYIPILDDPISQHDINYAMKDMKKGGYDYKLPVLQMVVSMFLPIIVLIMNFMFYLHYPVSLACSLLVALPKKGNLLLPKNWRGIQMLPSFGALYDRILANRLHKWIGVDNEQTAFQKGKSTLHQLFTLRLLIEIAYHTDTTLYIGFFDIEKAFDKISRLLLLQKLVKLGIGSCMLAALKLLYMPTYCILSFYGQKSQRFETCTGIRQGASSSVFLFIIFINDLIEYLKDRCIAETLIDTMHSLLHADDTAILATNRELFVIKCNHMLDYFRINKLNLNLSKSAYLIINGKDIDTKTDITLNNGRLEYKPQVVYLGAIFSDSGDRKNDVCLYLSTKRSNMTVKYVNFCSKNYLAPLIIKLKVLNTCVSAALVYGCETWGDFNTKSLETLYRTGLKCALSIRNTTNNEIAYIESGQYPLEVKTTKQQLKFWNTLMKDKQQNPNAPLSKLIDYGLNINVKYLAYYKTLANKYSSPEDCKIKLEKKFRDTWCNKIHNSKSKDDQCKLATYLKVNTDLQPPAYDMNAFEIERISKTRYRTGSHNLLIETGRMVKPTPIPREERICLCNTDIQTLEHCLLTCPLLAHIRPSDNFSTVSDALENVKINFFLVDMEHILKLKKYIS